MSCDDKLTVCRGSSARAGQSGFGLIELSIALLLLSIGALGLASLQISARRLGHEALQRSEAAALAMDILERMRANRGALPDYRTAGLGAGAAPPLVQPGRDCNSDRCSAQQLTAWDLWQWEQGLNGAAVTDSAGGLVKPSACVRVIGRRVTVEIAWQGFRPLAGNAAAVTCGAGGYGPGDAARQWLRMTSYIGLESDNG